MCVRVSASRWTASQHQLLGQGTVHPSSSTYKMDSEDKDWNMTGVNALKEFDCSSLFTAMCTDNSSFAAMIRGTSCNNQCLVVQRWSRSRNGAEDTKPWALSYRLPNLVAPENTPLDKAASKLLARPLHQRPTMQRQHGGSNEPLCTGSMALIRVCHMRRSARYGDGGGGT